MHSRPVRYSSGCCATAATADFGPTWWECWSGFVLQLRCVGRCRLAFMHRGFTDVLCASVCERSSDSSRFRPATHSSHFLRSRCSLRIIPAAGLTSRRNVQTHRSAGTPRARWARPELGRDPDVTPDQHCEEWGGYLEYRAARRGPVVHAHHRLSSTPSRGVSMITSLLLKRLTSRAQRTARRAMEPW